MNELDFSALDSIQAADNNADLKQPVEEENAGLSSLQRKADNRKRELEEAAAVYREYQLASRRSDQLRAEILKGIRAGEDIYSLFLKAGRAIALMTHNSVFYSQLEKDVLEIYGNGLQEQAPLQIQIDAAKTRLQKLQEAEARESSQQLQAAIRAHKDKIQQLESLRQ